jgi:hypothetical protein
MILAQFAKGLEGFDYNASINPVAGAILKGRAAIGFGAQQSVRQGGA